MYVERYVCIDVHGRICRNNLESAEVFVYAWGAYGGTRVYVLIVYWYIWRGVNACVPREYVAVCGGVCMPACPGSVLVCIKGHVYIPGECVGVYERMCLH